MFSRIFKALKKRILYPFVYLQYARIRHITKARFAELRSRVKDGDECLIIANGPSVKSVDFARYADHKVITMNRAYVKWEDLLGHDPFLHVCVNQLVMEEFKRDLINLNCPCIFNFASVRNDPWQSREGIVPILMGFGIGDRVSREIGKPFSSSGTVTFVALNLAILLGFKKIKIVGLDHKFSDEGDKNQTVTMRGEDTNHFFGSYFPEGMKWELPDLERSERGYRLINEFCVSNRICVINESTYTECHVFPRAAS